MGSVLIVSSRNNHDSNYCVKENHICRMLMDFLILNGVKSKQVIMDLDERDESKIYKMCLEYNTIVFWMHKYNIKSTLKQIKRLSDNKVAFIWFKNKECYVEIHKSYDIVDINVVIGEDLEMIAGSINSINRESITYCDRKSIIVSRQPSTIKSHTYLDEIVYRGGLCEVVRSRQCMNACLECKVKSMMDSEYVPNHDFLDEIELVAQNAITKKITILSGDFFLIPETNNKLIASMNSLSQKYNVKFSIYCCYKDIIRNLRRLSALKGSLYNIEMFVDFDDERAFKVLDKLKNFDIRIKLDFFMFSNKSTISGLFKQLDYVMKGNFVSNPDLIFKMHSLPSKNIDAIRKAWSWIYSKFLVSEHIRLIERENDLKYPFRSGSNTDYSQLPLIDLEIKLIGMKLNYIMYYLLKQVLKNAEMNFYDTGRMISNLLKDERDIIAELITLVT